MPVIEDHQIRRVLLAVEVPLLAFIFGMVLLGNDSQPDMSVVCQYDAPQSGRWRYIILHHSATKSGNACIFDQYHRQRGMDEVAYHFIIGNGDKLGDGEIEATSRWREQKHGAHAGVEPYNEYGIGVCVVGDFESGGQVTPAQFEALVQLCAYLMRTYHIPIQNIKRHCDIRATKCPGANFPYGELIQRLREEEAKAAADDSASE